MNREFHFYALYLVARRAGLGEDEVRRIAASSQYVDDAVVGLELDLGPRAYLAKPTQNYLFWDREVSREVYLPFHFLPGDTARSSAERLDGAVNPFITTPDSPIARAALIEALRARDPFRIGIALHAYADTWAHQHFSSRLEEANQVEPGSPLPAVGHLQAQKAPDQAIGRWTDARLKPQHADIDNRARFLDAARMIYRFLRTSRKEGFADEDLVLGELREIWSGRARSSAERIADFRILLEIEPYDRRTWLEDAGVRDRAGTAVDAEEERESGYDKLEWLKGEIRHRVAGGDGFRRVDSGGRFAGSELRRWYDAADAHRGFVLARAAAAGLPIGGP